MQEEPEHTGEEDFVDAFVQKLELHESSIMEASLCDNSKDVAYYIAEGIAKKFQMKSNTNHAIFGWVMTSNNEHSMSRNGVCLEAL